MIAIVRFLIVMLLTAAPLMATAQKQQRTIKSAKSEKTATQKRISDATKKLSDNQKQTEQSLRQLNLLRGEIDQKESQIAATRQQVEQINGEIRLAEDSIRLLDAKLDALKESYKKALRKLQTSRGFTDELSYIFSSRSFREAYARIRYVRQFGEWRKRKTQEIRRATENIKNKRQQLSQLQSQRQSSLNALSLDQAQLVARRDEAGKLHSQLEADGKSLKQALDKEKLRLRNIDTEISRMIEAERREKERREAERRERERKAREEQKRKDAEKRKQKQSTPAPSKSSPGKSSPKTEPAKPAQPTPKAPSPKAPINNSDPDAVMTRRFEDARGSMLFPVASPYRIIGKYGSVAGQPSSTGIEIILDGTDTARAIFDGTVSRIFQNHDGNYSVMVRHGAYITVFYNISSPAVKAGSAIKAGQSVGKVGVDPRYGKPMLHFEIRKGSQTLNPQSWVK